MSLFLGLGDNYKARTADNQGNVRQQLAVSPAQVLDVCLDVNSPLYKSPSDIGCIRFRLIGIGEAYSRDFEDQVTTIAYPLDRSFTRYPFPGEQVIIYSAVGDLQRRSADSDQLSSIPFYSMVVSSLMNITYNGHPFMGNNKKVIREGEVLSQQEAAGRFDQKVGDPSLVKDDGNKVKIFKQLRPFEGDFILQGRFGNTVRFGSTSTTSNAPWSPTQAGAPGMSGDPIMLIRVDRNNTVSSEDMFTVEDINQDDASIYLCSSQRVELNLSCSSRMKTWARTLGVEDPSSKATSELVKSIQP